MKNEDIIQDKRSRKFIFVPFCIFCQAFQAQGLVKYDWHGVLRPIAEELIKRDINLIQMPCPETLFFGIEKGLKRKPAGLDYYDTPEFRKHCKHLAEKMLEVIQGILKNGYEILAILGIEYSPSCAIKLQYTKNGVVHKPGIFIEELGNLLKKNGINIPLVGIDRKSIKKSLEKVRNLFKPEVNLENFFKEL